MFKTLAFQCRGHEFYSWSGNEYPTCLRVQSKIKKKTKKQTKKPQPSLKRGHVVWGRVSIPYYGRAEKHTRDSEAVQSLATAKAINTLRLEGQRKGQCNRSLELG